MAQPPIGLPPSVPPIPPLPTPQQPAPAPPPTAAPTPPGTVRLDIEVPDGANVGDRLTFNTAAGQFSLVVPTGAAPGKKMMVTMPVPANFQNHQQLAIKELRINGQLPAPKHTPEQIAMTKAHRQIVEAHWGRFGAQEKVQVNLACELAAYKPRSEAVALRPWGFWNIPTAMLDVAAAAEWPAHKSRGISTSSFRFLGARWELALEPHPTTTLTLTAPLNFTVTLTPTLTRIRTLNPNPDSNLNLNPNPNPNQVGARAGGDAAAVAARRGQRRRRGRRRRRRRRQPWGRQRRGQGWRRWCGQGR